MPVTLMKTMSACAECQKSAHSSMFITAGSCSVMFVCPTRRTRICHGCVDGSAAGARWGRAASAPRAWPEPGREFSA